VKGNPCAKRRSILDAQAQFLAFFKRCATFVFGSIVVTKAIKFFGEFGFLRRGRGSRPDFLLITSICKV
jgi:hypothetical protein